MIINIPKVKKILDEERVASTSYNPIYSMNIAASSTKCVNQVRDIVRQKVRTDEEYQRMYEKAERKGLNPEDMKFIDQTAYDDTNVRS